jgi:hypothetical protein
VVVPVEEVHRLSRPRPVGGVLDLVVRAGGVAALALHREDLAPPGAGVLERHRLAERGRRAVARRSGVELEEERLALHLRVAGEVAVVAQVEQVFPVQRALLRVRHQIRGSPVCVAQPQGLVVDRQHRVHDRAAVPRDEHEAVPKAALGPADVPAHRAEREATSSGTFEREPPGCPLCRRLSIRSMH